MNPKRPKLAAEYKPLVLLVKTYLSDILSPIFGIHEQKSHALPFLKRTILAGTELPHWHFVCKRKLARWADAIWKLSCAARRAEPTLLVPPNRRHNKRLNKQAMGITVA